MINFDNLEFVITRPVFPSNSIVKVRFTTNIIAEKEKNEEFLIEKIGHFLIGKKSKNPTEIEYGLNKEDKESFKRFMFDKCKISKKELDINTDVLEIKIQAELAYCNIGILKEEINNIEKMKIESLFGSCVIV